MPKSKKARLSVFKGRQARLHFGILQTLALKGPLTIYEIHKQIRTCRGLRFTRYEGVNRRVKGLEASGYIRRRGSRQTQAGFEAALYESTSKASVAFFLDSVSLEDLMARVDEERALQLLATLVWSIGAC